MKILLDNIFKEYQFSCKEYEFSKVESKVYYRNNDETYVMIFINKLLVTTQNDIMNICEQIYKSDSFNKGQKSNLSLIIVTQIDWILDNNQKNFIYQLEENSLFYKKFVLWYKEDEIQEVNKKYTYGISKNIILNTLTDGEEFTSFKSQNNNVYDLLSRIAIKLPFIALSDVKTLDNSLIEEIQKDINILNENLYDTIVKNKSNINKWLELIEIKTADIEKEFGKELKKEFKKVGKSL